MSSTVTELRSFFNRVKDRFLNPDKLDVAAVFFWCIAVLFLFWGLGDRSLAGSEERWAEISRSMAASGDYFHPRINTIEYFDKPLLSYWLIVLISKLTGTLNEWAVRFPSAFSGLIVLWTTIFLGKRLWTPSVGRTAGWLLLLSYGLVFWSRIGEADMQNLAAIMLAVTWFVTHRERTDFISYLIFYLICFLGAQTKGLTSVVVPIGIVFAEIIRGGAWKKQINFSHFFALAIGSCLYIIPFLYASSTSVNYKSSGLYMVFRENIERYLTPFDHIEPFYVYFANVPQLFLPWSLLLIVALVGLKELYAKPEKQTRWLIESIAFIFLFFTFSGSRRLYYILPILPFCALYTSLFWEQSSFRKAKRVALVGQSVIMCSLAGSFILIPGLWQFIQQSSGFTPPLSAKLVIPVMGLFALSFLLPRIRDYSGVQTLFRIDRHLAALLLMAVLLGGSCGWIFVSFERYRTLKPFALEVKKIAEGVQPENIALYKSTNVDFIFYLDAPGPIQILESKTDVTTFLKKDRAPKVLVVRYEFLPEVVPLLPLSVREKPLVIEPVLPWDDHMSRKLNAWKITSPRRQKGKPQKRMVSNEEE